jgi:hypothetical protein
MIPPLLHQIVGGTCRVSNSITSYCVIPWRGPWPRCITSQGDSFESVHWLEGEGSVVVLEKYVYSRKYLVATCSKSIVALKTISRKAFRIECYQFHQQKPRCTINKVFSRAARACSTLLKYNKLKRNINFKA